MILNDRQIEFEVMVSEMIRPFVNRQVRDEGGQRVVSYGLSSFGYDIRIGTKFQVFSNAYGVEVDPKRFDPKAMVEIDVRAHESIVIPPNSFALGLSLEYFSLPRDIVSVCVGKSTYARCGIVVNVTPFEPLWRGHAVLEISNTTPLPARIYACEGIAQVLFFRGDPCKVGYEDRGGKYQDQRKIVTALV